MIDRLVRSRFLYLLIFVFYGIGLWGMSVPLTGDQKVYLSIALEMRERGEWIIPYLFGAPNFLKPPLQYWATLLGWKVFGLSLFGALIPSVLALIGSAFFVDRIAKREFGAHSRLSGLLFAATLGTMTYGTTAQMEIWIVFFYLWAWSEWLEGRTLRAFLVVGVMAWVKGPLYPALWVLSSWGYLWLKKEPRRVVSKRMLLSLIAGIAVGLLWYALAARTQLQAMMDVFLLRENVGKMRTSQGSIPGLWGNFLYSLFPWVLLLIPVGLDRSSRGKLRAHLPFLLGYAALPAVFFTFFPYRVNTYLYLLTPIAAWMVAEAWPEKSDARNRVTRMLGGLTLLFAIVGVFLLLRLVLGGWIGVEIGVPLALAFALWTIFSWKGDLTRIALVSLLIVNLIRIGAVEIGENDLAGLRNYHAQVAGPIGYWLESKDIWHEFGLVSAALQTDLSRLEGKAQVEAFLNRGGSVILQDDQTWAEPGVECVDWIRLRRRMKFPLIRLLKEGLAHDDPALIRRFRICKKS